MSVDRLSPEDYVPGINVERLPLPAGLRFETHVHREHQVVWTASRSILVAVGERTWVLPPTLALWVPAGVVHTTSARRATAMCGVFVHPQIPSPWPEPTVLAVTAVVRELFDLLSDVELLGPTRERAESLLLDLLRPVSVHAISLPMPIGARALEVLCCSRSARRSRRASSSWAARSAPAGGPSRGSSSRRPGSPSASGGPTPGCGWR
ncbi:MAG: AraC family ligand binding domain-containing protein [Pseudonocardia sp.]